MHAFTHLDQTQHGTLEFPAEYYYVDDLHPRYQMPFHWHKEWELLRIKSGTFLILLENEQFTAKAGDVLLIRGGVLHGGIPNSCVYECFVFDLYGLFRSSEMVKKHLRPFYRQEICPQSYYPSQPENSIHQITNELMSVFSTTDATLSSCRELETVSCVCKLFSWIIRNGYYTIVTSSTYADNRRISQVKTVLEYIEAHYNSCISLEELAGLIGMNAKYFCKFFASLTHQTPMDYVNFYRIEHAAYLLDSTDLSITFIGSECGFSESSYFTKVFKKYKGITPKEYRHSRTQNTASQHNCQSPLGYPAAIVL